MYFYTQLFLNFISEDLPQQFKVYLKALCQKNLIQRPSHVAAKQKKPKV